VESKNLSGNGKYMLIICSLIYTSSSWPGVGLDMMFSSISKILCSLVAHGMLLELKPKNSSYQSHKKSTKIVEINFSREEPTFKSNKRK
jgi:hypothetical protein